MKIEVSRQINAPVEKVFDVFSDLSKTEERIQGINSIEVLEGNPRIEVGTKWKETRTMFGKEATEVMWVTDVQPNTSYIVEAESHGTHYKTQYDFSEENGGTRVDMVFEGTPLSVSARIFSLMMVFFKGATVKALEADMDDLQRVSESA